VRISLVLLVCVLVTRVAKTSSSSLCRRAAPPRRVARRLRRDLADRVALVSLSIARVSPWCRLRV
jgi:hypothetical protein